MLTRVVLVTAGVVQVDAQFGGFAMPRIAMPRMNFANWSMFPSGGFFNTGNTATTVVPARPIAATTVLRDGFSPDEESTDEWNPIGRILNKFLPCCDGVCPPCKDDDDDDDDDKKAWFKDPRETKLIFPDFEQDPSRVLCCDGKCGVGTCGQDPDFQQYFNYNDPAAAKSTKGFADHMLPCCDGVCPPCKDDDDDEDDDKMGQVRAFFPNGFGDGHFCGGIGDQNPFEEILPGVPDCPADAAGDGDDRGVSFP